MIECIFCGDELELRGDSGFCNRCDAFTMQEDAE
jgi:hypothetical protein